MLQSVIVTGATQESRGEKINQLWPCLKENLTNQPDVFVVDQGEDKISINTIREIKKWLGRKAYQAPQQLVIINQAQNLTIEAQNAFLKTLEEPPQKTIIILSVDNHYRLLPTIISRCQVINLANQPINQSTKTKSQLITLLANDLGAQLLFARQKKKEKTDFFINWLTEEKGADFANDQEKLVVFNFLAKAINLSQTNISARFILDYLFAQKPAPNTSKKPSK